MRRQKSHERPKLRSAAARWALAALVCVFVTGTGPAEACCQLGGSACGDAFAVSCNNGVVCFPPWRSCPGCICTATAGGQTCLAATSEPGTVSTLHVNKSSQSAGSLDLDWGASCSGAGPDYSVHEGQLGIWFSHAPLLCSSGNALSATIVPSGGDR